jgi:2-polyprenyl-6-methoxyphenol hydroxylase-like FAD-dependent oxidoreductase
MPTPRHAVVIGGSLAGLCVARVLADHVDQVTIVDRDRFPDTPTVRKGVPQAHHLHVLITAGQRALEQLFPGFLAELYEAGSVPVAAPTDILYLTATGWRERFPATHQLVGASRELIDWIVRERLLANGRVRFLPGHDVVGLLPSGPGGAGAVGGVALRPGATPWAPWRRTPRATLCAAWRRARGVARRAAGLSSWRRISWWTRAGVARVPPTGWPVSAIPGRNRRASTPGWGTPAAGTSCPTAQHAIGRTS